VTAAARNRAASAAAVALYLAGAALALPDPAERAALHYTVVTTLGYGHLIGARRPALRRRGLAAAARLLGGTNAVLLGALAVARWPLLVLPLLAVSAWHTVENDLALADAYARGRGPGPLPRRFAPHLAAAAATLAVAGLACAGLRESDLGALLASPSVARLAPLLASVPAPAPPFADLIAALTLHHLASWLVLLADRVRALARFDPAAARRLGHRLLAVHLGPAAALLGLAAAPGEAAAALRALLTSPSLYLLGSALHVLQTVRARGLEPRAARAAA
jgi:hypothetical protein